MLKRYKRSLVRTFFMLDLLIVLCGFFAAACVRFGAEGWHLSVVSASVSKSFL